jgi:hypothetical protein
MTFYLDDVNVLQKVISRKIYQNIVVVGVLKVKDENSRIRSGSIGQRHGSAPKCHGSTTLLRTNPHLEMFKGWDLLFLSSFLFKNCPSISFLS